MLKSIDEDIFECDADIILNQVDCRGFMDNGVAERIRDKFPSVFRRYKYLCECYKANLAFELLGHIQICYCTEKKEKTKIINMFAQDEFGYKDTVEIDYVAFKHCLKKVNMICSGKNVAVPYLIGSCEDHRDWLFIVRIIEEELTNCNVTIYKIVGGAKC